MKRRLGLFLMITLAFILDGCKMFEPVRSKADSLIYGLWDFSTIPEQTEDENLFFDTSSLYYCVDNNEDSFRPVKANVLSLGREEKFVSTLSLKHDYGFRIKVMRPNDAKYFYNAKVFISKNMDHSELIDLYNLDKNMSLNCTGDTIRFNFNKTALNSLYEIKEKKVELLICLFSREGNLVDTCTVEILLTKGDVLELGEYVLGTIADYEKFGIDYRDTFEVSGVDSTVVLHEGLVPEYEITINVFEAQAKALSDAGIECEIRLPFFGDAKENSKYRIVELVEDNTSDSPESEKEFPLGEVELTSGHDENLKFLLLSITYFDFSFGADNYVYEYIYRFYDVTDESETEYGSFVGAVKLKLVIVIK